MSARFTEQPRARGGSVSKSGGEESDVRFRAVALTLTRTSPAEGTGTGQAGSSVRTSEGWPGVLKTQAFIVVAI